MAKPRSRRAHARASQRSDRRRPETIDGKTGKPDPTPGRRIDLSSLRDVRLEMAEVYRKVDRKEIESQDGSRRAFILRQIADVIINNELERRVAELEAHAENNTLRPGGSTALPIRTLN